MSNEKVYILCEYYVVDNMESVEFMHSAYTSKEEAEKAAKMLNDYENTREDVGHKKTYYVRGGFKMLEKCLPTVQDLLYYVNEEY